MSKYEHLPDELFRNDRGPLETLPNVYNVGEEQLNISYQNLHKKDTELIDLLLTNDPDGLKKTIVDLGDELTQEREKVSQLETKERDLSESIATLRNDNAILQESFQELGDIIYEKENLIVSLREKMEEDGGANYVETEDIIIKNNKIQQQRGLIETLQDITERQGRIIDEGSSRIEALQIQLIDYKAKISQLQQKLEARDELLSKVGGDAHVELDQLYKELFDEEKDSKDEVIYRLEVANEKLRKTVKELEHKLGNPYQGGSSVENMGRLVQQEDLIKLSIYKRFVASIGTGTYRIALVFRNEKGGKELEMLIENQQYNVVGNGNQKMAIGLGGKNIRYEYSNGGLPRDHIHKKGSFSLTLYDRGRVIRPTVSYDYQFVPSNAVSNSSGGGDSVVDFRDGTTLYTNQVTTNLYKLKMLVLDTQ
jgi:predicted RNase H-like nuclease (RuvC/YqgF family)